MKVYPNPVLNILTLHWEPSEAQYADLIISNPDGKVVLKQKVESVTTADHRLDLKILGLSPGMYLISLINRDSIVSKRVILTG